MKRGNCQNCSVNQDLGRFSNLQLIPIVLVNSEFDPAINSLFEIPDHAAQNIRSFFC